LYIRISGMRSFGKKSSIDMIIVIVLGSVIARGIAGASAFGATAASSAVLVLVHRFITWLTLKYKWVEKLVKGEKTLLFENGVFFRRNMYRTGITEEDILESLRLVAKTGDMKKVVVAYMETNGKISFILKPDS
jgi:uncharacterized membrane protein YcaP (DUF421 family)